MAGLLDYAVEDVAVVVLEDAKGDPMIGSDGKHIIVELYSPGTKQYENARAKQSAALINLMKKKGKVDQSPESKARDTAEFLANCTKSMTENLGPGFEDLSGHALYMAVYMNRSTGFVVDQLSAQLAEWGNFTNVSTKN